MTAPASPSPYVIRAARERAGLTQAQAAALLNAGQVTWARYESGSRSLTAHAWRYWLHVAGLERMSFRAAQTQKRAAE